ncbi:MAG: hypothetical protein RL020_215 [Pseudomonadota bacterium]|jgi:hypothetical protein
MRPLTMNKSPMKSSKTPLKDMVQKSAVLPRDEDKQKALIILDDLPEAVLISLWRDFEFFMQHGASSAKKPLAYLTALVRQRKRAIADQPPFDEELH